ncbi:hypothetical protein PHLGIDRAFT_38396 [Phlebiopsis gigantea 11061_1 CR5-6]|uniref:Microbial-type PARG catalytic domain-containing protein n=1 Tax=Phlebiopsis gigantea (strain 11061_1 CR5-6) TaxID=745531 RepID=A0A0C3N9F4_PHLG1|nr:hypothetical protein PHLGIDRAFT_38396 [Phlebiopsis gigantea 11061_1 CR5-6]
MKHRKESTARRSRQRRAATPTLLSRMGLSLDVKRQRAKQEAIAKKKRATNMEARQTKKPLSKSPRSRMLAIAALKATRQRWAAIAEETRRIVTGDGTLQSFSVQLSVQSTTFYPHHSGSLAQWAATSRRASAATGATTIDFLHCSTLTAARLSAPTSTQPVAGSSKLGVLSFASPKKPGGGYLHGGDEQEEVIARLSSLVASLNSPAARGFYEEHKKYRTEDGSGLHDHSMVYSPGVVVFRADADDDVYSAPDDAVGGAFISPYTVDVLSAVPVNAAAVRSKHTILPSERQFFEDGIRQVAKERMARALRVFEERGDRTLILGAFGCSSSENNVETIAAIWAELLVCGDGSEVGEARFKDVFDRVVFAVPGKRFAQFKDAFEMRVFEDEVAKAALSD